VRRHPGGCSAEVVCIDWWKYWFDALAQAWTDFFAKGPERRRSGAYVTLHANLV